LVVAGVFLPMGISDLAQLRVLRPGMSQPQHVLEDHDEECNPRSDQLRVVEVRGLVQLFVERVGSEHRLLSIDASLHLGKRSARLPACRR
jgi:hypothetical protein